MSISGSVLTAFLLLAPGFAFFFGCFWKDSNDRVSVEMESPNSALAASVIGIGAILGHLTWALICWLNSYVTSMGVGLAGASAYTLHEIMFSWSEDAKLREPDIAAATLSTLGMLTTTFLMALVFARSRLGRKLLDPVRYGWAADIVARSRLKGRFPAAFVLTSIESDGAFLGYEGALDSLNLDSKREITSISLKFVGRFIVSVSPRGLLRRPVRRDLIPHIYIERAHIRNVAFNIFELGGGDAEAASGSS